MLFAFIIEHAANMAKSPQKRKFPRTFPFSFQFIFVFKILSKYSNVLLDDVLDRLLHFWRCAKKSAVRYLDALAFFHQSNVLPELSLGAQLYGALVVTPFAVLLASE